MRNNLFGLFLSVCAALIPQLSFAVPHSVSGAVIHIVGVSEDLSNAYAITTTATLATACTGGALYIRFEDKALYATALTAAALGVSTTIHYDDASTTGYAYGVINDGCEIYSITW